MNQRVIQPIFRPQALPVLVAILLSALLLLTASGIGDNVAAMHASSSMTQRALPQQYESNGGSGDEWEGWVLDLPVGGLAGTWKVLAGDGTTLTITSDAATVFDPVDPARYTTDVWVEVRGVLLANGTIQATEIDLDEYEDGEIVVRMQSAADLDRLIEAAEFDSADLNVKSTLLASAHIYLLSTDDGEPDLVDRIRAVKQNYGVVWVELNYVQSVPEDDGYKTWGWGGPKEPAGYGTQDAYRQVGLPPVLGSYSGQGETISILDTGVYSAHEQFAGRLIWPGLDVIDDDMAPDDTGPGLAWGHGTHVAGIVARMAPKAKLLPVRVLDSSGRGNTFLLAYAIEWAVANGATVINMSLGTEFDSQILRDAVANAVQAGVVLVAASGNQGTEQVHYPAGYDRVLGVTSVTYLQAELRFVKSSFANYGELWVDLAAPGDGVISAMINQQGAGYATWSGTSMATAFAGGAAALAQQKLRKQSSTSATLVDPVLELLVGKGAVIDGQGAVWDQKIGRLLDVDAALLPDPRNLLYLPALMQSP